MPFNPPPQIPQKTTIEAKQAFETVNHQQLTNSIQYDQTRQFQPCQNNEYLYDQSQEDQVFQLQEDIHQKYLNTNFLKINELIPKWKQWKKLVKKSEIGYQRFQCNLRVIVLSIIDKKMIDGGVVIVAWCGDQTGIGQFFISKRQFVKEGQVLQLREAYLTKMGGHRKQKIIKAYHGLAQGLQKIIQSQHKINKIGSRFLSNYPTQQYDQHIYKIKQLTDKMSITLDQPTSEQQQNIALRQEKLNEREQNQFLLQNQDKFHDSMKVQYSYYCYQKCTHIDIKKDTSHQEIFISQIFFLKHRYQKPQLLQVWDFLLKNISKLLSIPEPQLKKTFSAFKLEQSISLIEELKPQAFDCLENEQFQKISCCEIAYLIKFFKTKTTTYELSNKLGNVTQKMLEKYSKQEKNEAVVNQLLRIVLETFSDIFGDKGSKNLPKQVLQSLNPPKSLLRQQTQKNPSGKISLFRTGLSLQHLPPVQISSVQQIYKQDKEKYFSAVVRILGIYGSNPEFNKMFTYILVGDPTGQALLRVRVGSPHIKIGNIVLITHLKLKNWQGSKIIQSSYNLSKIRIIPIKINTIGANLVPKNLKEIIKNKEGTIDQIQFQKIRMNQREYDPFFMHLLNKSSLEYDEIQFWQPQVTVERSYQNYKISQLKNLKKKNGLFSFNMQKVMVLHIIKNPKFICYPNQVRFLGGDSSGIADFLVWKQRKEPKVGQVLNFQQVTVVYLQGKQMQVKLLKKQSSYNISDQQVHYNSIYFLSQHAKQVFFQNRREIQTACNGFNLKGQNSLHNRNYRQRQNNYNRDSYRSDKTYSYMQNHYGYGQTKQNNYQYQNNQYPAQNYYQKTRQQKLGHWTEQEYQTSHQYYENSPTTPHYGYNMHPGYQSFKYEPKNTRQEYERENNKGYQQIDSRYRENQGSKYQRESRQEEEYYGRYCSTLNSQPYKDKKIYKPKQ